VTTLGGTTAYAYDGAGRLSAVTDPAGRRTTYTYDTAGNRTGLSYSNGITTSYRYDTLNRLTNLTQTRAADSAVLASYTYVLGPAGNRTQVRENSGRTVNYTYDALLRLTQETIIGDPAAINGSIAYTYDAVGNRLSRTSTLAAAPSTNYSYDANNQLLTAGSASFTWDSNGNLRSQTDGTATTAYAYDGANRLTNVTRPGAVGSIQYKYDGLNNRLQSTGPNGTRNYVVDPFGLDGLSHVLQEKDAAGAAVANYVFGAELVSQQVGVNTSYYLADGQGSTRGLADTTGAVSDTFAYDAFGVPLRQTGATPNLYRYNGQQLDPNLGFYYLRARYYDPMVGRLISRDPLPGRAYDPRTLHPYVYAANDPVNLADPTGREFDMVSLECVSVIVGISGGIGDYSQHGNISRAMTVGVLYGLAAYFGGTAALMGSAALFRALYPAAAAAGMQGSNTIYQFSERAQSSGLDEKIENEARIVANELAEMGANAGPGAQQIEQKLNIWKTSENSLDYILDHAVGGISPQPMKDFGMFVLARVHARVWELLMNEAVIAGMEHSQVEFWILADCTISRLLGYPATLWKVRLGPKVVQC
jgi:RHS repeat-associated protein